MQKLYFASVWSLIQQWHYLKFKKIEIYFCGLPCVWINGPQKRSSVEVSILVGYDATSLDNWFLTLWDNVAISCSRVKRSKKTLWPLKMRLLRCLEMLGMDFPPMWCHIPEKWKPQLHHCKTLKTYRSSVELCDVWIQHFRRSNKKLYLMECHIKIYKPESAKCIF